MDTINLNKNKNETIISISKTVGKKDAAIHISYWDNSKATQREIDLFMQIVEQLEQLTTPKGQE